MKLGILLACSLVLTLALSMSPAASAPAREAEVEIRMSRESLSAFVQALVGTTVCYQGKEQENLQSAQMLLQEARIVDLGEGKIRVAMEGNIFFRYRARPDEYLGIPREEGMEIAPRVDFGAEVALIPEVDRSGCRLVLKARIGQLRLKRAEGMYALLIHLPGMQQLVRYQINRALEDMTIELLDLSPYLVPQEVRLQQRRWAADRTLLIDPQGIEIEVNPRGLQMKASARLSPRQVPGQGSRGPTSVLESTGSGADHHQHHLEPALTLDGMRLVGGHDNHITGPELVRLRGDGDLRFAFEQVN